jgi:hypothetical protein
MKPWLLLFLSSFGLVRLVAASTSLIDAPYALDTRLESRSISFENPTGAPGAGGTAASNLGVGRKGAPRKTIEPGETVVLCDIEGPGTIRHIWMTGTWRHFQWMQERQPGRDTLLRTTILRAFWDGQEHPSIECPLGDFMGFAHSKITPYESAVHSVGEHGALNFWIPMPFTRSARITLTNDSDLDFILYYQIDYTLRDEHPEDVGRLHTCFRRENPTTLGEDFELLPQRRGRGRFIGALMGIRTLHPGWWGEGEVKFYLDGDTDFPTICGTGSEDYVGLSYGMQNTTYAYHGCNLLFESDKTVEALNIKREVMVPMNREFISIYRWHLPDPIYWAEACRVTIQQIGCCYYEREDDWSSATFWYEPIPSEPLPALPDRASRIADLSELLE